MYIGKRDSLNEFWKATGKIAKCDDLITMIWYEIFLECFPPIKTKLQTLGWNTFFICLKPHLFLLTV